MKIKRYPAPNDIFSIVGVYLAAYVLFGLLARLAVKLLEGRWETWTDASLQGASAAGAYVLTFLVSIGYALWLRRRRRGEGGKLGWRGFDPLVLLWGAVLMFGASVAIEPLVNLFPADLEHMYSTLAGNGWMVFTTLALAPVAEEIFFRGILQRDLTLRYGAMRGILAGAAVFAVVHLYPAMVINAFVLGLVLGFLYYRTRSLWVTVFLHFLNNLTAQFLYMLYGERAAEITLRRMIGADWAYWTLYGLSCLGVAYTVVRIVRLRRAGAEAPVGGEDGFPEAVSGEGSLQNKGEEPSV